MLTIDTAAAYLLERSLVSPASVLGGELMITSVTRRNRNLRVTRRDGPGYMIKQPDPASGNAVASLSAEAEFCQFCHTDPLAAGAAPAVPRPAFFDHDPMLVAFELIAPAIPMGRHVWSSAENGPSTSVYEALGDVLGTIHQTFPTDAISARLPWLHRQLPWIVRAHKPSPALLAELSSANYQTLQIMQRHGDISRQLDALRDAWSPTTLIHNDIKSDNVLVVADAMPGVRLIDWELVQIGDPAWDVAGVLQDAVILWVQSMTPAPTPEAMEPSARLPWADRQLALKAFWRRYRSAARLDGPSANALLSRAVLYSAARLIQSAFEMAHDSSQLPAGSVLLLQVSANIFEDPALAQMQLYRLFREAA
jgi:hypothetical protein